MLEEGKEGGTQNPLDAALGSWDLNCFFRSPCCKRVMELLSSVSFSNGVGCKI